MGRVSDRGLSVNYKPSIMLLLFPPTLVHSTYVHGVSRFKDSGSLDPVPVQLVLVQVPLGSSSSLEEGTKIFLRPYVRRIDVNVRTRRRVEFLEVCGVSVGPTSSVVLLPFHPAVLGPGPPLFPSIPSSSVTVLHLPHPKSLLPVQQPNVRSPWS